MSRRAPRGGPPRLAEAFLRGRLPNDAPSRTILGDLREDYLEELTRRSRWTADLWYWSQAVSVAVRFADKRRAGHATSPARGGYGPESLLGALRVDLRLAVRRLARSPGHALTTVATLTIGIAGTVAIFSVLDAALFQALPYPAADELVYGRTTFDGRVNPTSSYPDYIDYRDRSDAFQSLSLIRSGVQSQTITGGERPERVAVNWVTVDLFETLAVEPELGRRFATGEAEPGTEWVAMLSHGFWQRYLGGSPEAVGSTLVMDGFAHTVVGVTPAGFRFRNDADLWLPIRDGDMDTRGRTSHSWNIVGRLRTGVPLEQAQEQVAVIAGQLSEAYAETHEDKALLLTPLGQALAESYRPGLLLLMAATAILLLIACSNVAGLILAGATTRRTELSLRSALGASRGRLVRQLFAESLMTAAVAGALGSAFALSLQRLLLTFMPLDLLGVRDIGLSKPMLGFAVAVSVGTAVLFGVGPALTATRVSPADDLRSGVRHSSKGRAGRVRAGMVVVQVALAVVLLSGSGLMLRSFLGLRGVDVGFDTDNLLVAGVALPMAEYSDSEARLQFFRALAEDVESLPGAESASFVNMVPLLHRYMDWSIWDPENPPSDDEDNPGAFSRTVLPGYFETMGIPILRGRDHEYRDAEDTERRIVLSESLAEALFGGEDPLGRRVSVFNSVDDPLLYEVIGVVGDIRMTALADEPLPQMYFGYASWPNTTMNMVVRAGSDAVAMIRPLRDGISRRDPDVLVTYASTMQEIVADSWWGRRLLSYTVAAFALVAVLLSIGGLYGILAFQVACRTYEIGIRVALGATRSKVSESVLFDGLVLVGAGLAVGLPAALAVTGLLRWQLFGVEPADPATYAGVALCFLFVAGLACLVPTRRALRIDPVRALNTE